MKTDELKPCPFCGSKARFFVDHEGVKVMCTDCDCSTKVFDDLNPFTGMRTWRKAERENAVEEAAARWNKRVIDGN